MTPAGYRYLLIHGAILAAVLAIAWLTQSWLICLGAYLAVVLIWHSRHLLALHAWLQDSQRQPPAAWGLTQSGGLWRQVFEHLFRQQQRHNKLHGKLRRALEEYRTATESFPEPIISLDEHNTIVWCNAAACSDLGLRKPDDMDQPVVNILRNPIFVEWLEAGGQRPVDIESPRDDNIKLNVRMFSLSQRRRLLLFRDVTELRNVETVRRDFVANVSHELRTPLTVLIGYLESLADEGGSELRLITERMHEQTRHMRSLIDDLIEISRLQGQVVRGQETEVKMASLMAQLREQADSLNTKRHQINFACNAEFNIQGIESDLDSAFTNLITNAIRYTPDGGRIQVSWDIADNTAVLSVRDNGIGIPHADIPRLTERFYRVAKDRARTSGGSGLGLSIVKHVLNAHDAHLEIDSDLGVGSVFRCVFPQHRLVPVTDRQDPQRRSA